MKLYIDQKNNVVTMHEASEDMKCFEEFENSKRNKGFRKSSPYITQYEYDR